MADAWGGSWNTAWGNSWGTLVGDYTITDTDVLQKPVDYFLARKQSVKGRWLEWDAKPLNRRDTVTVRTQGARKLGGNSTFTVKTGSKGYD